MAEQVEKQPRMDQLKGVMKQVDDAIHGARMKIVNDSQMDPGGDSPAQARWDALEVFKAGLQMGIDGSTATLRIGRSETLEFRIEQANPTGNSSTERPRPNLPVDIHG